jgi:UDP-glucose 4-epimerase
MKYLVTGGAGFIGSNLIEDLLVAGHDLVVVDNLSTGSLDNIAGFKNKIKFIESDVADVLSLDELKGIDGIYHLGVPSTTMLYRNDPLLVGKAINQFIEILELAKRENCRMVWASSSSVYNGNKPPFTEDLPVLVKDFYTEARYGMERIAKLYNDFYGVKSVGFRFFSVYGPHEEAKKTFANLVSQFLWAMEKGEAPLIYGDGTQTRDFTFVGDIVNGFIAGMASSIECDVFNLGTNRNYSLNELVLLLNKALGTNIEPTYQENPLKNYVEETLADVSKVQKSLDWKSQVALEEGIKLILQ